MAIYEISLTPLLEMMIKFVADIESAKFAKFAKMRNDPDMVEPNTLFNMIQTLETIQELRNL